MAPGVALEDAAGGTPAARSAPGERLYAGPFMLSDGCRWRAWGRCCTRKGRSRWSKPANATVRDVSIQGGGVGMVVRGNVALERVHFSGHRDAGVVVEPGGSASLSACVFEGAVEGSTAVSVKGGQARLDGGVVRGGWKRGLEGSEATHCEAAACDVRGHHRAGAGARRGGDVGERVGGGWRGAAFFVSHGALTLKNATVHGQEYGLQTGAGSVVRVDGLVKRPQLVAVALPADSDSRLAHLALETPGTQGAIQVLGGQAVVEDAALKDVQSLGVLVRKAKATLRRISIDGVRNDQAVDGSGDQGDGFNLRDSEVELDDVR